MGKNPSKNKIITSDCFDHMSKLKSGSFDHCITDPPYNISGYDHKKEIGWLKSNKVWRNEKNFQKINEDWDSFSDDDYELFLRKLIQEICRLVKPNGNIVIFGSYHNIYQIGYIFKQMNLRIVNSLIWYKRNAFPNVTQRMFCESTEQMIWAVNNSVKKAKNWTFNYEELKTLTENGKQMRNMWDIPMTPKNEKEFGKHPSQKPIQVMDRLVIGLSNKKEMILDPFCGSGSTLVSSKKNGRSYYGIDSNPEFTKLSRKRVLEISKQRSLL